MNKNNLFKMALPPVVLAVILSLVYLLPMNTALQESAISPHLPYGTELAGWFGEKTQASKEERGTLAADTIFSKGIYQRCSLQTGSSTNGVFRYGAPVSVSIVYSGSDMNSSIHRPERCLPAQGHQELRAEDRNLKLANGKNITFCRLQSYTLPEKKGQAPLQHIHYYVFIGHDRICHTHMGRTLYDIWDRISKGRAQRWAYLQVGSHWGGNSGLTEADAESALLELLSELAARQINWNNIED
ncbi:MAG: exosortase-associated EpsI family protein [Akkermansia sp.]|nr:exosortase-associated EpsI family protein [Akkermansia sp.]